MPNRFVEWFQGDQFAAASLNKIELFEVKGKRSLSLKNSVDLASPVSCISCNASRAVVAVGQHTGSVSTTDWENNPILIYDSTASRRSCTAVSWNDLNPTQLAAGFEKSRSQGEFSAVVWDTEAGKVLFRPSSEEPIASICWLNAHVLLAGTSISWVRLYDVRTKGGGQGGEIMSIMAHASTRPRCFYFLCSLLMSYWTGLFVLRRTCRQDYETLFHVVILSKHHHHHQESEGNSL
jgi:hypothetical protein